jgi:hypothetical protein
VESDGLARMFDLNLRRRLHSGLRFRANPLSRMSEHVCTVRDTARRGPSSRARRRPWSTYEAGLGIRWTSGEARAGLPGQTRPQGQLHQAPKVLKQAASITGADDADLDRMVA